MQNYYYKTKLTFYDWITYFNHTVHTHVYIYTRNTIQNNFILEFDDMEEVHG